MSGSCIETAEAPAWLSKLERQREKLSKGKLGHDSGAGAACNTCGSKCPGLDLHFWRKVCRNCHCPKDVHDVQDDDTSGWAQFELLGTARPKKANHTVMKIRGISDEPVKLEWVPPNTSPDMVSDYMSSLGEGLAPVAGSGGAARRREQLRRQIPPHDINSDLCCHKLTQQEQVDHKEYISRIKNQVVGMGNLVRIGTIQKGDILSINTEGSQPVPGTKSYSLPLRVSSLGKGIKFANVPKNTTDKHLVLDSQGNVITKSAHIADYRTSPIISRIVRDKLNLMLIESDRIKSAVEHGPIYDRMFIDLKQLNVPVESDVYLNPIKIFRSEYNVNPKFKDETTAFVESQGAKIVTPSSLNNNDSSLRSQKSGTIFGPNGEIWSWATHTEDPNNPINSVHAINANPNYYSTSDSVGVHKQHSNPLSPPRKGNWQDNNYDDSDVPPLPNYDTYPGELTRPMPKKDGLSMMDANPIYGNVDDSEQSDTLSPLKNYRGAHPGNNRNSDYSQIHDSEISYIPDDMVERVGELGINPNDNNFDPMSHIPCQRCKLPFQQGQVVVNAERAGKNASWHPQCFTCHKCEQLLADMVYFYYQGEVYCARDFAEALKIPRCAACDELIFSMSYTAAEDRFFHVKHFCCYHCDVPLGGKQYIPDNKTGQPMCLDCDSKFHAVKCNSCKNIIAPEQQGVSWTKFHWHGSCFNCSSKMCGKSLLGGKFVIRNELPFCSAACLTSK